MACGKGRVRAGHLGLQSYTDTRVFEADREDALVDLVKLDELQEVNEESVTIVHSIVLSASFLTL